MKLADTVNILKSILGLGVTGALIKYLFLDPRERAFTLITVRRASDFSFGLLIVLASTITAVITSALHLIPFYTIYLIISG